MSELLKTKDKRFTKKQILKLRESGRLGGLVTLKTKGRNHYKKIARLRWKKHNEQKNIKRG